MKDAAELKRLEELRRLMILDTRPERAFDDLTRMAAEVCLAPLALITLVDDDRQWFKSRVGIFPEETPRSWSFCAHAIENQEEVLIVPDTKKDPRFAKNPLVTGEPHIRFYAGAPLVTPSGIAIGTICVLDIKPRDLSKHAQDMLPFLARQVVEMLEKRATAMNMKPAAH